MEAEYSVAEIVKEDRFPYACTGCGYRGQAQFRVAARAEAAAAVGPARDPNADAKALERADWVAAKNMDRQRPIIPCPRCQAVDPAGQAAWRKNRLTFAAVAGVLAAGLLAVGATGVSAIGWIMGGLLAPGACQFAWQAYHPPKLDVSFDPPR